MCGSVLMSLFVRTWRCSMGSRHCAFNIQVRGTLRVNVAPCVCMLWSNRAWRYNSTNSYLGTRWRWVISYASPPLYSRGVALQQHFKSRSRMSRCPSGRCGVDKALHCPESNSVVHSLVYWLYRQSQLNVVSCFPIVIDLFARLEAVHWLYTCWAASVV